MHSSCIFQNFFYLSRTISMEFQGGSLSPPSSTARVSGTCSNGLNANFQRGFDVVGDQGALGLLHLDAIRNTFCSWDFLAKIKITCSSSVATKMPSKFLQPFPGFSSLGVRWCTNITFPKSVLRSYAELRLRVDGQPWSGCSIANEELEFHTMLPVFPPK